MQPFDHWLGSGQIPDNPCKARPRERSGCMWKSPNVAAQDEDWFEDFRQPPAVSGLISQFLFCIWLAEQAWLALAWLGLA